MFKKPKKPDPRLSYPTRHVPEGAEIIEEYIIPDGEKAQVLEQLYPYDVMHGGQARRSGRVRQVGPPLPLKAISSPLMT
jgi:hypothetical protein